MGPGPLCQCMSGCPKEWGSRPGWISPSMTSRAKLGWAAQVEEGQQGSAAVSGQILCNFDLAHLALDNFKARRSPWSREEYSVRCCKLLWRNESSEHLKNFVVSLWVQVLLEFFKLCKSPVNDLLKGGLFATKKLVVDIRREST